MPNHTSTESNVVPNGASLLQTALWFGIREMEKRITALEEMNTAIVAKINEILKIVSPDPMPENMPPDEEK